MDDSALTFGGVFGKQGLHDRECPCGVQPGVRTLFIFDGETALEFPAKKHEEYPHEVCETANTDGVSGPRTRALERVLKSIGVPGHGNFAPE